MHAVRPIRATFVCVFCVVSLLVQTSVAATYPHVQGLVEDARVLRIAGNFDGAEGKLARAQRIAPRSADVYLEFAYLRKDQGDYQDLKNVVAVGADISDGPPQSLAQLKILEKNLSALSMPVAPRESFSTPPAKASEPLVADSRPRIQVTQLDSSAVASGQENAPDLLESSVDSTYQDVELVESTGNRIIAEKLPQELSVKRAIESSEQFQVGGQEAELLGSTGSNDMPRASRPQGDVVDSVSPRDLIDNSKGRFDESMRSEGGQKIIGSEVTKSSQIVKGVGSGDASMVAKTRPTFKTRFVGLGILASPQSGTWMSRGPIEIDY